MLQHFETCVSLERRGGVSVRDGGTSTALYRSWQEPGLDFFSSRHFSEKALCFQPFSPVYNAFPHPTHIDRHLITFVKAVLSRHSFS
ncbi:hypothetical protein J0X15_10870 [Roseibium sp. CAU 1637]|uniref:Uncharacterized protein n=1 Tax=Roseibium limicola TaxID=2816037 RepID=A0A939EPK4_9HYPH|nr:hypothetical protein [Roseibium limicola]MBO0345722.1 hypothetical protein [Roseibium limicola]